MRTVMTIARTIAVTLALGVAWSLACAAAEPLRLVCIGDSITQGSDHTAGGKATQSWRYPLWKHCLEAGIAIDFVGTMTTGFEGTPAYPDVLGKSFPNRHEGRWGWPTDKVDEVLKTAAQSWVADIAIILLGTNDKDKDKTLEPTLKAMRGIVATLRGRNPKMRIAIGEPYSEWKPMPAMGAAYVTLAKDLDSRESPVIAVATSDGWISKPDLPGTCTVDWVHPNTVGDERLAQTFLAALKPWLVQKK